MTRALRLAVLPALLCLGCEADPPPGDPSSDASSGSTDSGHSAGQDGAGTGGGHAPTDSGNAGHGADTGLGDDGDTGETDPGLPEYCAGAPAIVDCNPDRNLDPFWEFSADIPLQTPAGGILSLPFTTRTSEVDGGQLSLTTIENVFVDDRSFRLWFSETPGGDPLVADTACQMFFRQARGGTYWTQNPTHTDNTAFCHLGAEERVLYVNFDVCPINEAGSCVGEREGGYRFDLRRNYRAY